MNAARDIGLSAVTGLTARRGDAALLVLLVAVIALLVMPIPPALLDALIATNIALSLGLLMVAMYVSSPLGLSTFPTLLLLTTLLRLSLNIASTKQILLKVYAGEIIETFGKLIVAGNVVVGIVVFLIIAVVQFIVIAKGAERVAEVGARFTLDGMPGKQMSIDADLRVGIISKDEARRRRSLLEQESQFHGAMDGAMKFVKGDAIAGVIIAFVNIVGGITIGMLIHEMAFAAALHRYTVLSVGDGMVAQIPSLFVSIAAGVLITRVGSDDAQDANLGAQIGRQILDQPVAILLTAVVLVGFVVTPGFPKLQFGALAAGLAVVAWVVLRAPARRRSFENTPMPSMRRHGERDTPMLIHREEEVRVAALAVRLSPECSKLLDPTGFDLALAAARQRIRRSVGIPFPGVVMTYDADLARAAYVIEVQELPQSEGVLRGHRFGEGATKGAFESGAARAAGWGPFRDGIWLTGAARDGGETPSEVRWYTAAEVLARHIEWVVLRQPDIFIGFQETHMLVDELSKESPELSQELGRTVPLQRIADVLRRLVQESISIRPFREICESLIVWSPREKDPVLLTEFVRIDLGRYIAHRYGKGSGALPALILDPVTEQVIRRAVQPTAAGNYVALKPEESRLLHESVARALAQAKHLDAPVLMASMDIRRYVRRLLEPKYPQLPVLSYQEIGSHVTLESVARVAMEAGISPQ